VSIETTPRATGAEECSVPLPGRGPGTLQGSQDHTLLGEEWLTRFLFKG
jgi:hypothetical protein